jgi:alkylation response protein AidB-like acyl-CoA dehydrogenase
VDFTDTEDQTTLAAMTESVLAKLGASDPSGLDGYDESVWKALVDHGLVRSALPEKFGGDGLGLAPYASVLTVLGRRAERTPCLATVACGVLPLLAYGASQSHEADLRAVGDGDILTAAVAEVGDAVPDRPGTTLERSGDGVVLHGRKIAVPYAEQARAILVTTNAGVVVVPRDTPGMSVTAVRSSTGAPEATVVFDEVHLPASAVVGDDCTVVNDHLRCATASFADGLAAGALRLTADHLAAREQFGRPLGTFQAVSQQIADAYVVARTVHLVAVSATWRVSEGLDARADTALAAYWVSTELPKMMQQCHHLHGGTGADVTYPMHRFFSSARDIARYLGGPSDTLESLGALCTSI